MSKGRKLLKSMIADEAIINNIFFTRGQKIMLDFDLAELYQVETRRLNEAVKRNIERFPKDFMFRLTTKEWGNMMSQFAISSQIKRKTSSPPYAFTEQGVSMLSGVLNTPIAIQVHIQIIRVFTKMKELLLSHKDILLKLEKLEKDVKENKKDIALIFEALKQLLSPPQSKRRMIGFNRKEDE
ncbi:MAG: ORF6N domain-containing protein [Bacteroidetes bacterium]|nr:ORF6N domain-containing protein [Bacteroidota bacterium]